MTKNPTPLVSVVMCTYNHEDYIGQAIEGVLNQKTNFPYELIIGEDCSTDGTRSIVLDYAERNPTIIRVVTSDRNVGAIKNGYRTYHAAHGKYIATCEGDDFWCRDDKLQTQVDYLERHPECGLVHSEIDMMNEFEGRLIKRFHDSQKAINTRPITDLFYEIFMKHYWIRTCTVCLRRDLLIQIMDSNPEVFVSGRFGFSDTPLWLEMSLICKFHYIDEVLAVYRKHEGGVSGLKERSEFINFEILVYDMLVYYLEKYQYGNKVPRSYLDRYASNIFRYAFDTKDAKLAEKTKGMRGNLSFKLSLLYYGSKSKALNAVLRPIFELKKKLHPGRLKSL